MNDEIVIDGETYKKIEKGGKIFEDNHRRIEVDEKGSIDIYSKPPNENIPFHHAISLPLLYEAVEYSKKVRGLLR